MKGRIDWEDVRCFSALARAGALGQAAAALGVSQVTVMRRVRALEAALGAVLFLRRRDGHRLTAAGADLARAAEAGGDLIAEGLDRVAAAGGAGPARVRIVTTELVASWILIPHLARARTGSAPLLEIDVSPAERSLTEDAETIAVRFRRPASGALRVRKLGEIPFALYRAPDADAGAGPLGWAGEFQEVGMARWLAACFPGAQPALAFTTLDGHRRAALAGLGVAGLPRFVGDSETGLVAREGSAPAFSLTAWMVVSDQIARQPKIRRAVSMVAAAFEHAVGRRPDGSAAR